ncbi:MAG: hypothetical protein R2710_02835 [Acidimicrobiales bacterium]
MTAIDVSDDSALDDRRRRSGPRNRGRHLRRRLSVLRRGLRQSDELRQGIIPPAIRGLAVAASGGSSCRC